MVHTQRVSHSEEFALAFPGYVAKHTYICSYSTRHRVYSSIELSLVHRIAITTNQVLIYGLFNQSPCGAFQTRIS